MTRTGETAAAASAASRQPRGHTFAFIGGLHRSGTTLLAHCLAAHSEASGFINTAASEDEGQHLQSVYPAADKHGGPGQFGFSAEMHMTELSPIATDANRRRLLADWGVHWNCERTVLIEKSPPNLIKTRFLQAMFPDARFIMVMRHPIATAFATQKWSGTRLDSLIRHWLVCNETMASDMQHLRHVTVVRYEDLVTDWDNELTRLHEFLELPPQPHDLELRHGLNSTYLARWEQMRRDLARSVYRGFIVQRYENRVNRFGYSLRHPTELAERQVMLDGFIRTADRGRS